MKDAVGHAAAQTLRAVAQETPQHANSQPSAEVQHASGCERGRQNARTFVNVRTCVRACACVRVARQLLGVKSARQQRRFAPDDDTDATCWRAPQASRHEACPRCARTHRMKAASDDARLGALLERPAPDFIVRFVDADAGLMSGIMAKFV